MTRSSLTPDGLSRILLELGGLVKNQADRSGRFRGGAALGVLPNAQKNELAVTKQGGGGVSLNRALWDLFQRR